MENTFWVDDHGGSEFGAMLLADYSVGAPSISQDYVVAYTGSRITAGGTRYGLRTITLPVVIEGRSPEDAEDKRSHLTAALLKRTVELCLPDGGLYTCLLTDGGKKAEIDRDGKFIEMSYTLVGYKHGPLETLVFTNPDGTISFFAAGTAETMECRITATVAKSYSGTVYVFYPNSTQSNCIFNSGALKGGDTVIVDGIEKRLTVNGSAGMKLLNKISGGWPRVVRGENKLYTSQTTMPFSQIAIEYYPIYI